MKFTSRTLPGVVIEDITSVDITPDAVVVLHVDFSNMPVSRITEISARLTTMMKQVFPNNYVVVLDQKIKMSIANLIP